MPQAAPLVATEAAVASTMTAAEIAAAEAAAAHAAQVAAAQTLAAEQAAALAAQQATAATTAAAEQAANSGLQTLAQEVAGTQPAGIETLNVGQAPVTGPTPGMSEAQYQFIHNSTASTDPAATAEIIQSLPSAGTKPPFDFGYADKFNYVDAVAEVPAVSTPVNVTSVPTPVVNPGPAPYQAGSLPEFNPQKYLIDTMPGSVAPTPPAPPAAPFYGSGPVSSTSMGPNTFSDIYKGDPSLYTIDKAPGYSSLNARPDLAEPSKYSLGNQAGNYNIVQTGPPAPPQEPGGLQGLFNQGLDYAKNNKLTTLMGANTLYNALNKPDPYEEKKYKSTFKPGLYTGYTPVQPTPYQPQYAVGGLADLGGYSDYARGGRLLKGPGDGMSDDIPATIANKQPARLANEEFVVPADVVSHLGNGSSEAGAKVLYKMMERVRKARTGNKKQGKQINPDKYLA